MNRYWCGVIMMGLIGLSTWSLHGKSNDEKISDLLGSLGSVGGTVKNIATGKAFGSMGTMVNVVPDKYKYSFVVINDTDQPISVARKDYDVWLGATIKGGPEATMGAKVSVGSWTTASDPFRRMQLPMGVCMWNKAGDIIMVDERIELGDPSFKFYYDPYYYHIYKRNGITYAENLNQVTTTTDDFSVNILNKLDQETVLEFNKDGVSYKVGIEPHSLAFLQSSQEPYSLLARPQERRFFSFSGPVAAQIPVPHESIVGMSYTYAVGQTGVELQGLSLGHCDYLEKNNIMRMRDINPVRCFFGFVLDNKRARRM